MLAKFAETKNGKLITLFTNFQKKKRFNFKSDFGGNDFGISFDRNNNKHHTII